MRMMHKMITKRPQKNLLNRYSPEDMLYYIVSYLIIGLLVLLVLYPLVYIISASVSDAKAVNSGKVWLYPVGLSLYSYKIVLQYKSLYIGYQNSLFYTLAGTLINVMITLICAYPLSRKNLMGRGPIMFFFTFTMLFSGGMIPGYLLVQNLRLLDTVWSMLLPGALSVYNMIITRTFIQSTIPEELLEASKIDGCSDTQYFIRVILPLSKAVIAVIALFYAVGHWNSYFNAFLYLSSKELYPLQIFLRQILIQNTFDSEMIMDEEVAEQLRALSEVLKYSIIVVASLPLLCFYPLAQKHFVKGVMIGSIKG